MNKNLLNLIVLSDAMDMYKSFLSAFWQQEQGREVFETMRIDFAVDEPLTSGLDELMLLNLAIVEDGIATISKQRAGRTPRDYFLDTTFIEKISPWPPFPLELAVRDYTCTLYTLLKNESRVRKKEQEQFDTWIVKTGIKKISEQYLRQTEAKD